MFMSAWGRCVGLKFCFLNFVQQRGTMTRFEKPQSVININVMHNAALDKLVLRTLAHMLAAPFPRDIKASKRAN
jgi:hypothetical protein